MHLKNTFAMFAIAVLASGIVGPLTAVAQTNELTRPPELRGDEQERKAGAVITDPWITMKIHSQFVPEDALEDSDIDVNTTNGMVTLSGTVATDAGRARAIAIAKATDGVKGVTDKLKVAPKDATGREAAGA